MHSNKVLFLTLHTFSLTGGIEKVCCSLAKVFSDLRIKFNLYSLHDSNSDIDTRYLKKEHFKGFKHGKLSFTISSILKGASADTVLLSHINLLFFAYLIKTISPSTKIIMLAHGIEIWRKLPKWKKIFLQDRVEIWAVSKYTAATLTEMHQIPANKIKVVNNCLDPFFELPQNFEKPTHLLERYGLDNKQPILFTLTRLSAQEGYKGYDRVIQALPKLLNEFPDLHYILGGKADETEKQRVLSLVKELNLNGRVTLASFIKADELTDHFKLGNLFVMPSTMEGFGIVFIEAAACGTKVIGGNADGSVDALLNGKLGKLIDPDSVEELSNAIAESLHGTTNPKVIQELCTTNFGYYNYVIEVKELILTNSNKIAQHGNR